MSYRTNRKTKGKFKFTTGRSSTGETREAEAWMDEMMARFLDSASEDFGDDKTNRAWQEVLAFARGGTSQTVSVSDRGVFDFVEGGLGRMLEVSEENFGVGPTDRAFKRFLKRAT